MIHPLWTHHMIYVHVVVWVMVPHLILASFVPNFLANFFYDLWCNKALVTILQELMAPRHNLYNKKTPKSYISSLLFGVFGLLHRFKPLWWIFKFEHEFRVWHPHHHEYAFVACPRLLRYQFLCYKLTPCYTTTCIRLRKGEVPCYKHWDWYIFHKLECVHLGSLYFAQCPSKIATLIGNIEDELESVRMTFVKHLQQGTPCTSLSCFKHLQESPKALTQAWNENLVY